MSHTIEDMKSAYVFFNDARFGGRLPSPYGWGMSLCVGRVDNGDADVDESRDRITFSDRVFGNDLRRDLYVLFHEMWHVYAGWDRSDSAHHVAISAHSGAWAAGMADNDIRVTSDVGHAVVIPGGSFDRLRDAWIDQWERGDAPSQELHSFPVAAIGIGAVMAVVVLLGMSVMNGRDDYGGYERAYSYGGNNYDDY
jgi:hypothetical protein